MKELFKNQQERKVDKEEMMAKRSVSGGVRRRRGGRRITRTKGKGTHERNVKMRGMEEEGLETVETVVSAADEATLKLYEQLAGTSLSATGDAAATAGSGSGSDAVSDAVANAVLAAPTLEGPTLAAVLAIPVLGAAAFAISKSLNSGAKVSALPASVAYELLVSDPAAVLVDVRDDQERKERGSPKATGKARRQVTSVPLLVKEKGSDELTANDEFVESVLALAAKRARNSEDGKGVVLLVDSYGNQSNGAARSISRAYAAAVKAAKAAEAKTPESGTMKLKRADPIAEMESLSIVTIAGGCEGARGWRECELPWQEPRVDVVTALLNSVSAASDTLKERPTLAGGLLAVGGVVAASSLFLTEIETAVEVVGAFTAVNYAVKNLLYAKDREKAVSKVKFVLDETTGRANAKRNRASSSAPSSSSSSAAANAAPTPKKEEVVVTSSVKETKKEEKQPPQQQQQQEEEVTAKSDAAGEEKSAREWIDGWRAKSESEKEAAAPSEDVTATKEPANKEEEVPVRTL